MIPLSVTINSASGTPTFAKGLKEGFLTLSDDEGTAPPGKQLAGAHLAHGADNPRLELTLGRTHGRGFTPVRLTPDQWVLLAFNNDDTDWLKINGSVVLNDKRWDTAAATVERV